MKSNFDAVSQVAYLKNEKDLAFNIMSEEEAVSFLSERSYFFKLKAFAKNYDKRFKEGKSKGCYIGLEFAYLVELSRIDKKLRDLVLHLTLDIEHYLKVRINKAAMVSGCNPCQLSEQYLNYSHTNAVKDQVSKVDILKARECFAKISSVMKDIDDKLDRQTAVAVANELENMLEEVTSGRDPDHVRNSYIAMGSSPYSGGIVEKYGWSNMPYWCLLELISFGPLINFYRACFRKDGLINDSQERETLKSVNNLLRRVQTLRNAAAHGDCLLNGLSCYTSSASMKNIKKKLQSREGLSCDVINQVSSVNIAMDLAAILMCYDILVPAGSTKSAAGRELNTFAQRIATKKDWFTKNYSIKSFIDYVTLIFPHFACRFTESGEIDDMA